MRWIVIPNEYTCTGIFNCVTQYQYKDNTFVYKFVITIDKHKNNGSSIMCKLTLFIYDCNYCSAIILLSHISLI